MCPGTFLALPIVKDEVESQEGKIKNEDKYSNDKQQQDRFQPDLAFFAVKEF